MSLSRDREEAVKAWRRSLPRDLHRSATPSLPDAVKDPALVHHVDCGCGSRLFTVDANDTREARKKLLAGEAVPDADLAQTRDGWSRVKGHVVSCGACGARTLTVPDKRHPLWIGKRDVSVPIVDKVERDKRGRLVIVGRFLAGATVEIDGKNYTADGELPEWPATVVTLEVKNEHGADARWHTVWPQPDAILPGNPNRPRRPIV